MKTVKKQKTDTHDLLEEVRNTPDPEAVRVAITEQIAAIIKRAEHDTGYRAALEKNREW
jgi:hypothetical protein